MRRNLLTNGDDLASSFVTWNDARLSSREPAGPMKDIVVTHTGDFNFHKDVVRSRLGSGKIVNFQVFRRPKCLDHNCFHLRNPINAKQAQLSA
jgi:hypothetical protein